MSQPDELEVDFPDFRAESRASPLVENILSYYIFSEKQNSYIYQTLYSSIKNPLYNFTLIAR